MRVSCFGRYALTSCAAAATVAGCGALPLSLSKGQDDTKWLIGAPGVVPRVTSPQTHSNVKYKVIYSFGAHSDDGSVPAAGLINIEDKLYGTTAVGGTKGCYYGNGCGTVFSVGLSGKEKVLYSFRVGSDGANPYAGFVYSKGRLYGATYYGGSYEYGSGCYYGQGCGTFFSIARSGAETVLHSFGGSGDGQNPFALLIKVNGALYGTTQHGGEDTDGGTVFKITPSGDETVLHSFGGSGDGAAPMAGLVSVKGALYGTTYFGGTNNIGTVFKITASGTETVLYSFSRGSDGAYPEGQLLDVHGTLYGTTQGGGSAGSGTVFSVTTAGKERVLYSFLGNPDGAGPVASLVVVNGVLYGTTELGGAYSDTSVGNGTVFSITTSGKERVLHRFAGNPDGTYPRAQLLDVHGTLYGTASNGGAYGDGIIFSLDPSLTRRAALSRSRHS